MKQRSAILRTLLPVVLVGVLGLVLAMAMSRTPASDTAPLKASIGKPATDFTAPLLDGGTFKLSDHRGKVVVLDFWAVYCAACKITMPGTEEIVARYPGAELFAVNVEESASDIKAAMGEFGIKSPVIVAGGTSIASTYQVLYLPQWVVIDRDGMIRAVGNPNDETWPKWLASEIESALNSGQALPK